MGAGRQHDPGHWTGLDVLKGRLWRAELSRLGTSLIRQQRERGAENDIVQQHEDDQDTPMFPLHDHVLCCEAATGSRQIRGRVATGREVARTRYIVVGRG